MSHRRRFSQHTTTRANTRTRVRRAHAKASLLLDDGARFEISALRVRSRSATWGVKYFFNDVSPRYIIFLVKASFSRNRPTCARKRIHAYARVISLSASPSLRDNHSPTLFITAPFLKQAHAFKSVRPTSTLLSQIKKSRSLITVWRSSTRSASRRRRLHSASPHEVARLSSRLQKIQTKHTSRARLTLASVKKERR